MEKMLSMRQIARRWGVSKKTIKRWKESDPDFPIPYRLGTLLRWKESQITSYLEKKWGQTGTNGDNWALRKGLT